MSRAPAHACTRGPETLVSVNKSTRRNKEEKNSPLYTWSLAARVFGSRLHPCGGMKVKKSSPTARLSLYVALCGAQHAAASICWTVLLSTPLLRWEVRLHHCCWHHHHTSSSSSSTSSSAPIQPPTHHSPFNWIKSLYRWPRICVRNWKH